MDEIKRKLIEIESRNKRSNIMYVLAGISILAIVGSLLLYSNVKRMNDRKDQKFIEAQIEYSLNQEQLSDSMRFVIAQYDSLQLDTEDKIHDLQSQLLKLKDSSNNASVKYSIRSIQRKVSQIDTRLHKTEYNKTSTIKRPTTAVVKPKYAIRLYSFKPDPKIKNELVSLLKQSNFTVKVYPDWTKKPSFFSKNAAILYYSDKTRKAAESLAALFANKMRLKFAVSKGSGLGVSDKEKDNTLIIHFQQNQTRSK